MKLLKTLLVLCTVAFAAVSMSEAQTTIRITGSSAFRAATHTAIGNILQSGYTYAYYGNSALNSASEAVFVGTTKSGSYPVVIQTSWSGSVGGIKTLTNNLTVDTWLKSSLAVSGGVQITTRTGNVESATADVAMSDTFQSSTSYKMPALTKTIVGVVPFVWTKGLTNDTTVSASLANVTNITPFLAQLVLTGPVQMSMFTGNHADADNYIYVVGRDEDSGTRLTAFADCGFGVTGSPSQYLATVSSGTISSVDIYPANTVLGVTYSAGHSGYSSGGTLAGVVNTPVASGATSADGVPFALISYFGINDAAKVNSGNNNLTYNGVAYTKDNVREGKYTFWSYEQLLYLSTLASTKKTVANLVATQILNVDADVSGILYSTMHVKRNVEGGLVFSN
jgi:hypothetical protein